MENIGQKIRKLRELRNYTQEYMAFNLNITQTAYCKIEKEESKLTVDRLKAISILLNLDPIQLLTFDEKVFFIGFTQKQEISQNFQNEDNNNQFNTRMNQLETEINVLRSLFNKV